MRSNVLLLITAFIHGAALAAGTPPTMNYQGVLRDAADRPRTGTFDMVFRFFELQISGGELLVDAHTGGGAVVVANGLFDVQLGGGTVTDGWGPGTYTSLGAMLQDYPDVWMQITIGAETLVPMIQIQASAYALNSGRLGGQPASNFLDTSPAPQTKSGPLAVTGSPAISGTNTYNGAVGELGSTFYQAGVLGFGGSTAGFFFNASGSQATIANWAEGIQAMGATTGGDFTSNSGVGEAILGSGNSGITAYGTSPGSAGHFDVVANVTPRGVVDLAQGDVGIVVSDGRPSGHFTANVGGYLAELGTDDSAAAHFQAPTAGIDTYFEAGYFPPVLGVASNGTKAFLQNHPEDPSRLIAYNALEGPETGTYTRGSGSIRGGEARIALDPTFALTTDPDIGLTAVVTPRRPRADLYVASVSTKELVVRSGSTSPDEVAFDYVVNGLRVGFENRPVILPSDGLPNATVPSPEAAAVRLAAMPEDSRASTPLARLSAERDRPGADPLELSGARALIAGINAPEHAQRRRSTEASRIASDGRTGTSPLMPDSFSMPVETEVEPGDIMSSDPMAPGRLRLAEAAGDPAVVGVVTGPAGGRFRGQAPIALPGKVVRCRVDASYRPIAVGDLLATSSTPGMAMSAGSNPRPGTVLGRALEPLPAGTGTILILVVSR
jgi:hypothetical protein